MTEPQPELTTTRTGGRSARLVALAIVVLLGATIYIGVTGRNTSTPSATPAPAIAFATPSGEPPRPIFEPPRIQVVFGSDDNPWSRIAASLDLGAASLFSPMEETAPGRLHVRYLVTNPEPASQASIAIAQVDDLATRATDYGTWSFDLGLFHGGVAEDAIVGSYGATVLLDANRPPDAQPAPDAPDIARDGYHIVVTGQRTADGEIVDVELDFTPPVIAGGGGTNQPPMPPSFMNWDPPEGELYRVTVKAGNQTVETFVVPGNDPRFEGSLSLAGVRARRVAIALDEIGPLADRPQPRNIGRWRVNIPPDDVRHAAQGLLQETVAAKTDNPSAPYLRRMPFTIHVDSRRMGNLTALFFLIETQ